jgi:hypothetical protein
MLAAARKQHRSAIEIFYEDVCNIIEYQSIKDPITKVTSKKEVTVLTNQSCNLSYSTPKSADTTNTTTNINQVPLLFISNDIAIKTGSKIVVTKKSKTVTTNITAYKNSSVPAVYSGHQEIALELFTGWA